jgi:hypothetical protein
MLFKTDTIKSRVKASIDKPEMLDFKDLTNLTYLSKQDEDIDLVIDALKM